METNRFQSYTRFGNSGPKLYASLAISAVVGSAVEEESAKAIEPLVDNVIYGNSGMAPAKLITELLDNLGTSGTQLCGTDIDEDYVRDVARRSQRIVLIAQYEGKIVAFAVLFEGRKHIEISVICSSAKSGLKRAGATLIKVAAQFAESLGKEEVYLEALRSRQTYYEQFGFTQSGNDTGLVPMSANIDTLLRGRPSFGGTRRRVTKRRRQTYKHRR